MFPNVDSNAWEYAVPQGFGDTKFGRNPDCGSAYESVWTRGGDYPWPAAAATSTVESSDAADTQTISLTGLDAEFNPYTIILSLTGTTPVTLPIDFYRIFRMRVEDTTSPAGNIYAKIDGVIVAEILIDRNTTEMMILTVPKGVELYVPQISGSTDGNKGTTFELWARNAGGVFYNTAHFYVSPEQGCYTLGFKPNKRFDSGSDLEIRSSSTLVGEVSAYAGGLFSPKWQDTQIFL